MELEDGTKTNFLSNFNFMDSKCCGKIYMLKNFQLIFQCQLCSKSNVFDLVDDLFEHYEDEHKYGQTLFESSPPVSEDDIHNDQDQKSDHEQQPESNISESHLEPIVQLNLGEISEDPLLSLNTTENNQIFLEETSSQDYFNVVETQGECESEHDQLSGGLEVTQDDSEEPLETAEQSDNIAEEYEQQQVIRGQRKGCQKKSRVAADKSDDSEVEYRKGKNNEDNAAYYTLHDSGIYTCNICDRQYKTKYKMRLHANYHKSMERNRDFPCDICGKSFKLNSNLLKHYKRHRGERSAQCPECPKQFESQSALRKHLVFHRGTKSFMCTTCGNMYFTLATLKEHQTRHTNERKYKCDKCEKTFFNSRLLRQHETTHSSVKGYKCDQCEAAYKSYSSLSVHKKKHLNLRQYKCTLCNAAFNARSGLWTHVKFVHRGG